MTAGRPVLTVPPEIDSFRRRHILVAWKDTRESRRAISDALPILANAGEVSVVEVVENGSSDSAQERVTDVARWLKQHGISASARALGAVENAANDMETIAADMSADLIVAGAYGHSRFSQWVFGGVTDKLLKQSIRCTLLSH
jgi:nucleotide-binding universal stress UspA family protein